MNFKPADLLSQTLFVILVMVMAVILVRAVRLTSPWKKWAALLGTLTILFTVASLSGIVARSFIPVGPMLILLVFIFAISFYFSKASHELSGILPFSVLIGFQSFRLPLELILHHWAEQGTIPSTMTWTGQNWDIITGVVSLIAIPFVNKSKALAFAINLVGFVLLLNVFRVVIMSSPLPFSWPLENPLLLIAHFPYALIGPLCVMPALIAHLVTFRKLRG